MSSTEIIERLAGPEAVERYGVCPCAAATIENQVWLVCRHVAIPDRNGNLDFGAAVVCGLCRGPLGWLEEIIGEPRW